MVFSEIINQDNIYKKNNSTDRTYFSLVIAKVSLVIQMTIDGVFCKKDRTQLNHI